VFEFKLGINDIWIFFSFHKDKFFFSIFLILVQISILHLTHCIISSISFGWNSFIFRLFQHLRSLTYEHVLTNSTLCGYVDMLKGLLTNEQMSMQKVKMEKCLMHLACKIPIMEFFHIMHGAWSPFYLFYFMDHKLHKFVGFLAIM